MECMKDFVKTCLKKKKEKNDSSVYIRYNKKYSPWETLTDP